VLGWFVGVALAVAPVCSDLVDDDMPPRVKIPNRWPDPTVRCLDTGPARETLLQRARRCVREEPEDPAAVRVLGALGGRRDVSTLETLAMSGWHAADVAEALGSMEEAGARDALLRVACGATNWLPAVEQLMRDPRPEELSLYLEAWDKRSSRAPWAIGELSTDGGRAWLVRRRSISGLARDLHPDAVAALRELVVLPKDARSALRGMDGEHPLFRELLDRVWSDPRAEMDLAGLAARLPDDEAQALLRRLLAEGSPIQQRVAGRLIGYEEARFEALARSIWEAGPPLAQVGMVQAGSGTLDALWDLLDDSEARWEAAEHLLLSLRGDEDRRRKVARGVLDEAPESEHALQRLAQHVLDGTHQPGASGFAAAAKVEGEAHPARPRRQPRDAAELRAQFQAWWDEGPTREQQAWGRAVMPWVWEGSAQLEQVRRLVLFDHPMVFADAADPAGLEAFAAADRRRTVKPHHRAWLRTDEAWERVNAYPRVHLLAAFVRPESFDRALSIAQERSEKHDGWPAFPSEPEAFDVSERRRWLANGMRDPLRMPENMLRGLADGKLYYEEPLARIAAHPGQRWRLWAYVDRLDDDQERASMVGALVNADWTTQAPPSDVVAAARGMASHGAYRLLAVVGDADGLAEHLDEATGLRSVVWRELFDVVTTVPGLDPSVVELVAERGRRGELTTQEQEKAWAVPQLRDVLGADPCTAVRLAKEPTFELSDEALLEAMTACPAGVPILPPERAARVQQLLIAAGDVQRALKVHLGNVPLLESYLDDRELRVEVLQQLSTAEPSPETWPRLHEWLATWTEEERPAFRELVRVYRRHRPVELRRVLGARVAEEDDVLAIDALIGLHSDLDALEALIPVVERGGVEAERVARRIQGVGKAVYERHRALVDGVLAPSWEVRE